MNLVAGRLALGAAALFAAFAFAATPDGVTAVPKLSARVTDLTSTLTTPQRDALQAKLAAFEAQKGSQVAVLLVPTLGTETIEEFAGRVTDEWKLGRKGIDDGALLVIAKQDRKIRIQTGRGTQGTLTDALSKRIVSDIVAPRFRDGDFAGGIDAGVDAIMKAIEGESLPAPSARRPKVGSVSSYSDFLFLGFFLVPVVGMFLRGILGRFLGASATSGLTGVAAWFILGSLGVGVIAAVVAFVITLFSGAGGVRGASRGGWGGGYLPGGFGGGGGGGGGGFSGGGGGFDGGGASGSW